MRFKRPLQPAALRAVSAVLGTASDADVRRPLWEFLPEEVPLVLHERRRRFGIEEERIDVSTLSDDEDLYLEVVPV